MNDMKSAMWRQAFSIPDLMDDSYAKLEKEVDQLCSGLNIQAMDTIIFTGCGDSLGAAISAKQMFMAFTRLNIEIVPAIELARVYPKERLGQHTPKTVVMAISVSGEVSRVVEAVMRVNALGGTTVGVSNNVNSALAVQTDQLLNLHIPSFEPAPGIRSYQMTLVALMLIAIKIAEMTGVMSTKDGNNIRREIKACAQHIRECIQQWDIDCYVIAHKLKECSSYEFIGAGDGYGSAWFGHAKIIEAIGKQATTVNTEDWLHMNYFVRDVYHTGTIIVANGACHTLSRVKEMLEVSSEMGRPLVIVSDDIAWSEHDVLRTPKLQVPYLNPLIQLIPVALLSSHLSDIMAEEYFRGGRDNWTACNNFATVVNSELVIHTE